MRHARHFAATVLTLAAAAGAAHAQATFEYIGRGIGITDLSEDGSVAVGNTIVDGLYETFRWTQATGWVRLGRETVSTTGTGAGTPDVSYDGTRVSATILGPPPESRGTVPPYQTQGIWIEGQGWTELLPPGPPDNIKLDSGYASAWGLSGDGTTVSGFYWTDHPLFGSARPSYSTIAGGAVGLTAPTGRSGRINAVNFDATVGCGWTETSFGQWMATVWRDGTDTWIAPDLGPGNNYLTTANGINADGSVIVGDWFNTQAARVDAARWDWNGAEYVLTPLGVLPGTPQTTIGRSFASSVSDDGNVIVGTNRFNDNGPYSVQTGFIWTPEDGMRDILDVMSDLGFSFPDSNWIVQNLEVSPDGRVIGGVVLDANTTAFFDYWSFILTLAPPPPACIGDLDGDDDTDVFDFNIFAPAFGTSLGDPGFIPAADLNDDDVIDVFDFNLFAPDFGCTP